MNFRSKLLLLFFAALPLTLAAQDKARIQVRFAAQALPPDMPEITMVAGEMVSPPFAISSESLTLAQEAPGRLFALRAAGTEKDFATIGLPASGGRFIILLVLAGQGKVATVVIPDDRTGFRAGDVYAYNASPHPVLGQLGTAKFGLTPATGKTVRPTGIVDDQYYEVRFAVQLDGSSRMFSSARWPAGDKERCYVFFYADAENPDRLRYRVISEVLHPEKKEE